MAIMFCLMSLAVLHFTEGCGTETDSSLRQTVANYSGCICREYLDTYATCYDLFTCKRFPTEFQTRLKCFTLRDSRIEKISVGDFANLSHITSLYIEMNKHLVNIESGSFKELKSLVYLSISYNTRLMKLEDDIFIGLDSLETLILTRNCFTSFKNFTASLKARYLKLKTIGFKEMNCTEVLKDDFKDLSGGQVMNVSFDNSQIDYVHPDALIALKTLQNLSVSDTMISEQNMVDILNRIVEEKIPLTSLSMNGWGFKFGVSNNLFRTVANTTTIKTLFLNNNMFHILGIGHFMKMPNIETVHMEQNMIIDVKKNGLSHFPNLKIFYVRQNILGTIPDGVQIPTLKVLDISSNSQLGSSYFTIEDNQFIKMSSLEVLILSNNNLRNILRKTFKGLVSLKRLYLRNCNIANLADYSFIELSNLEQLDLSRNRFPQIKFSKDIFKGLSNLQFLSLQNCKIDHFPREDIFGHLTSLETLNMDGNFLTEITPYFIASLRTLKTLSFSDNRIKIWNEMLFKNSKLENLAISRNKFTHLTEAMLADFNDFKTVDVSGNPFHCDCDTFVEPFNSLNRTLVNHILVMINQTSTFCLLPIKSENTTVVSYYLDNYKICDQHKREKIIKYLIPSIICLSFILILVRLSYSYRWHIRYWIFLAKIAISKRSQFKKRANVQGHTNYLYDAFVSYSTEDRNFVIRLVGMLENYEPFLKLCVFERDFEIGTVISESVLDNLSKSRKTLLIVSDSYIKSQWCVWEAQVAENHRLFFENEYDERVSDSLILIKLGDISSKNISPMLRYLMKTRIYLQWDPAEGKQKEFWEKLRNVIGPTTSNHDTLKQTANCSK